MLSNSTGQRHITSQKQPEFRRNFHVCYNLICQPSPRHQAFIFHQNSPANSFAPLLPLVTQFNLLYPPKTLLGRLLSLVRDVGVLEGPVPRVVSPAHQVWFAAGINRAMQLSLRFQSAGNISGVLVARLIGLGNWRPELVSVCGLHVEHHV
jgi:hypothetical protein